MSQSDLCSAAGMQTLGGGESMLPAPPVITAARLEKPRVDGHLKLPSRSATAGSHRFGSGLFK